MWVPVVDYSLVLRAISPVPYGRTSRYHWSCGPLILRPIIPVQ